MRDHNSTELMKAVNDQTSFGASMLVVTGEGLRHVPLNSAEAGELVQYMGKEMPGGGLVLSAPEYARTRREASIAEMVSDIKGRSDKIHAMAGVSPRHAAESAFGVDLQARSIGDLSAEIVNGLSQPAEPQSGPDDFDLPADFFDRADAPVAFTFGLDHAAPGRDRTGIAFGRRAEPLAVPATRITDASVPLLERIKTWTDGEIDTYYAGVWDGEGMAMEKAQAEAAAWYSRLDWFSVAMATAGGICFGYAVAMLS